MKASSRSFAGSKARYAYEEFLDNVDVKALRVLDEEYDEHNEGEDSSLPRRQ
jgi:hypothetical protein